MSGDVHQGERQAILVRLLNAVKQCQVRFGGRSELATDLDSRVLCLCGALESALQHGMKRTNSAVSTFKQMTERSGLGKVTNLFSDIKHTETESVFWHYAKEHLSKHEVQRFTKLNLVNTDLGRGRAWLRASLNEQALERYMLMLIESDQMLSQHYEHWAFLRDVERSSMLPNMAAGLGSILFAITVDKAELNGEHTSPASAHASSCLDLGNQADKEEEPRPFILEHVIEPEPRKKKDKRRKKKGTNVVIFDEGGTRGTVITRSSTYGSTVLPYSMKQQYHHVEAREAVGGTPDGNMLASEVFAGDETKEGSREPSLSVLSSFSSQVSCPSITSGSSRRTSVSSSSDDQDSRAHDLSSAGDGHKWLIQGTCLTPELSQPNLPSSNAASSDGGNSWDPTIALMNSMSLDELKQSVVSMMLKKESVQQQNIKLEGVVEQETKIASALKAEMEELKRQYEARFEREQVELQTLRRENELLKHQLKKYVSTVQSLRTGGISNDDSLGVQLDDPQTSLPSSTLTIDYSQETAEYEKKLVQVTEMHGELMEFNELLHRQLATKETLIRELREELIVLRGPLPYDRQTVSYSGQDVDSVCLQRPLINIWIPSAFLRGTASSTHHVYQVYVRIQDEEWNVYRRYSQFLDTHLGLKKVYPIIGTFEFPPKKTLGKKEIKLVEARRKVLQTYLRNVINLLMEKSAGMSTNVSKEKLISFLPFFSDRIDEDKGKDRE